MLVFVNSKPIQLQKQETIPVVLQHIQIAEPRGIAVAVNNEVVPKTDWEKFLLKENDQITVIRATQGG
ncbi:MAG TPA: sulfur carrier protein ThiS [Cytophagaceae bacterium]|jgi:sulfur carrier protein|nr:sulfur carrier protein ThiS [Cytophagaceae bacterium]